MKLSSLLKNLFRGSSSNRRRKALGSRMAEAVEVSETRDMLSGVTVLADPSPIGYPTGISATVDNIPVAELGTPTATQDLDAMFSAFGRGTGSDVYNGVLYVPGQSDAGAPIVTTWNLTSGEVGTIQMEDLNGVGGDWVVGSFVNSAGEIIFGGFSNIGFSQWHLSGSGSDVDSNVSSAFFISPSGKMLGYSNNDAAYFDSASDNLFVLPGKTGFYSSAAQISSDETYIVGGAFDDQLNYEGWLWKKENGSYILKKTDFLNPTGEIIDGLIHVETLGTTVVVSGSWYNVDGNLVSGLWDVDGNYLADLGEGVPADMEKIGGNFVFTMTQGTGEDRVIIVNSDLATRVYTATELGFSAGSTLLPGSLFVTADGDLGVIGTATNGVVTAKVFPFVAPTFSYEVDVTGDGIPELTGTTQGTLNTSWVFSTPGAKHIDVKMTSVAGEITGSKTVVVTPKLGITLPGVTKDTKPTIGWDGVLGALRTRVWLTNHTEDAPGQVLEWVDGGATSFTPAQDLNIGRYFAWVQTEFLTPDGPVLGPWSQGGSFAVRTQVGRPTVIMGDSPSFTWDAVAGATSYEVWVEDASRTRVIYEPAVVGTSCPFGDLPEGTYKVWVRANNQSVHKEYGTWSLPKSFGIAPQITGVDTSGSSTIISWAPVSGALKYDVWISRVSPWQNPTERDANVSGSSTSYTSSVGPGTYRVWVRVLGSKGWSTWSQMVEFEVT